MNVAETGTDGRTYGVIDPFGYYLRNCTSYVAWRLDQEGISLGSSPWGNATQWKNTATGKGYTFDTSPAAGAIAYWSSTNPHHPTFGHVAYVESYPSSTEVNTTDYNNMGTGQFSPHTYDPTQPASNSNDKPDGYIHIERGSSFAPNGTWLATTPSDLSFFMPGNVVNLYARGTDNAGGGLNHINITSYTPPPGAGWGVVKTTQYSNSPQSGDANAATIFPNTPYMLVSFDVYSNNGAYKKAPGGVRKYCNILMTSSCTHVAGEGGTAGGGLGGGTVCTTPPETSASTTGATAGNNSWWRSPVTVTLSGYAPCGGAGPQTYYSINGGTQNTYSNPIGFNQEGIYTVGYYSVDALGNTESAKTVVVSIDWTPPVTAGTATGPRDTNGIFRNDVTVGLNATDNLSGVDYNQYSRDGGTTWTTLPGNNNSFVIAGNGVSRAHYRSQDIAGNLEGAKDSGPIIINKYVLFSNAAGTTSMMIKNGTGSTITGDIFSGGAATISGNTGSTLGTTFATVGSPNIINGNTNTQIPPITTGAAPVPMLSYPLSLYKSLATVVFPADLTLDSVNNSWNGILYVEGNVTMYDVALSGPLSIIATGSITDMTTDSTFQTNDPYNGVLLYAGQNINVSSTGNRNLGLMYAPNGKIKVDATGLTLGGSLVGNQVELNGATTLNLSYNPAFSSNTYALPLAAMGLVAPTTTPPPLPGTPSLSKPAAGASVAKTRIAMGWNAVSGAVGYQLQISKSSTFSTLDYNVSRLSAADRVNLTGSTTYYWRVRAINQAGTGAWSAARSFTTQP